jgi:uncharacterized protein YdiU (UPF0061 family)
MKDETPSCRGDGRAARDPILREYFAAQGDTEGIRRLADYAIARHYPEAAGKKRPYRALLDVVIARQAHLIAQWMLFGFIHGAHRAIAWFEV